MHAAETAALAFVGSPLHAPAAKLPQTPAGVPIAAKVTAVIVPPPAQVRTSGVEPSTMQPQSVEPTETNRDGVWQTRTDRHRARAYTHTCAVARVRPGISAGVFAYGTGWLVHTVVILIACLIVAAVAELQRPLLFCQVCVWVQPVVAVPAPRQHI